MSDEPMDPLANFDQALAAIRDAARVVRTFYAGLVDEGFSESQALTLTGAYIQAFCG